MRWREGEETCISMIKYNYNNQAEGDEMGGIFSTNGDEY
jgi:hypothetical protein